MTGSLVATGELARPIVTDRCTRTYPEYDLMRRCRALVNLLFVLSMAVAAQSVPVVAQDKKDGVQPDGLKNLRHPDATVRYRTAALLAKQGPLAKFAIDELREALGDTDPFVRLKVAEAIWRVERPSPTVILPTLQRALKDKNPEVREAT